MGTETRNFSDNGYQLPGFYVKKIISRWGRKLLDKTLFAVAFVVVFWLKK